MIPTAPARVFAWLDDPRNTGLHMSRPSLAMLGGALRVERLSATATDVGATYRSWGRVLGLRIDFTTTVVRWVADREKVWRTIGDPRLIVLGHFEMRFGVEPVGGDTRLTMALDYELPSRGFGRLLGRALAARTRGGVCVGCVATRGRCSGLPRDCSTGSCFRWPVDWRDR